MARVAAAVARRRADAARRRAAARARARDATSGAGTGPARVARLAALSRHAGCAADRRPRRRRRPDAGGGGARSDAALRRPALYKSGARRRAGHGDVAPALARLRRERIEVARPRGDGVARGHPDRSQRALPPRRLARGRLRGPGRGLRRLGGNFIGAVARRAAPLARGARPPARPRAADTPEARPQVNSPPSSRFASINTLAVDHGLRGAAASDTSRAVARRRGRASR